MEGGPRHGQALDHSLGEVAHGVVGAAPQPHRVEALLHSLRLHAVQARVVGEVLAPAEIAVEQRVVSQVAHAAAHLPTAGRQRRAQHLGLTGVRAQQRGQYAQQRGLARAVGAQHGQRGARLEPQRHAVQRHALAVAALEPVQSDRRLGHPADATARVLGQRPGTQPAGRAPAGSSPA